MRIHYIIIITSLLFIAACNKKPKEVMNKITEGSSSQKTEQTKQNENINNQDTADLRDTIVPGSAKDFLINVGDRVFFDFDSSTITEKAQTTLKGQAAWLRAYPSVDLIIQGHTDERGTREYNLALGERRANSVKSYLIALGIASDRLQTISYGKERPAVLGSNEEAWRQNRRGVSVFVE